MTDTKPNTQSTVSPSAPTKSALTIPTYNEVDFKQYVEKDVHMVPRVLPTDTSHEDAALAIKNFNTYEAGVVKKIGRALTDEEKKGLGHSLRREQKAAEEGNLPEAFGHRKAREAFENGQIGIRHYKRIQSGLSQGALTTLDRNFTDHSKKGAVTVLKNHTGSDGILNIPSLIQGITNAAASKSTKQRSYINSNLQEYAENPTSDHGREALARAMTMSGYVESPFKAAKSWGNLRYQAVLQQKLKETIDANETDKIIKDHGITFPTDEEIAAIVEGTPIPEDDLTKFTTNRDILSTADKQIKAHNTAISTDPEIGDKIRENEELNVKMGEWNTTFAEYLGLSSEEFSELSPEQISETVDAMRTGRTATLDEIQANVDLLTTNTQDAIANALYQVDKERLSRQYNYDRKPFDDEYKDIAEEYNDFENFLKQYKTEASSFEETMTQNNKFIEEVYGKKLQAFYEENPHLQPENLQALLEETAQLQNTLRPQLEARRLAMDALAAKHNMGITDEGNLEHPWELREWVYANLNQYQAVKRGQAEKDANERINKSLGGFYKALAVATAPQTLAGVPHPLTHKREEGKWVKKDGLDDYSTFERKFVQGVYGLWSGIQHGYAQHVDSGAYRAARETDYTVEALGKEGDIHSVFEIKSAKDFWNYAAGAAPGAVLSAGLFMGTGGLGGLVAGTVGRGLGLGVAGVRNAAMIGQWTASMGMGTLTYSGPEYFKMISAGVDPRTAYWTATKLGVEAAAASLFFPNLFQSWVLGHFGKTYAKGLAQLGKTVGTGAAISALEIPAEMLAQKFVISGLNSVGFDISSEDAMRQIIDGGVGAAFFIPFIGIPGAFMKHYGSGANIADIAGALKGITPKDVPYFADYIAKAMALKGDGLTNAEKELLAYFQEAATGLEYSKESTKLTSDSPVKDFISRMDNAFKEISESSSTSLETEFTRLLKDAQSPEGLKTIDDAAKLSVLMQFAPFAVNQAGKAGFEAAVVLKNAARLQEKQNTNFDADAFIKDSPAYMESQVIAAFDTYSKSKSEADKAAVVSAMLQYEQVFHASRLVNNKEHNSTIFSTKKFGFTTDGGPAVIEKHIIKPAALARKLKITVKDAAELIDAAYKLGEEGTVSGSSMLEGDVVWVDEDGKPCII